MTMLNEAKKFEGIKTMLEAAQKAGNSSATSEEFCVDLGLSWEVFSMYNGIIAELATWMQPYHTARRKETAMGAELMTAEERKKLKDPVWNAWKKLIHGLGMKCTKDDFEVIWKAYERQDKNNKEGVYAVGGNTNYMFRKGIDIELGFRLAKVKAMGPAELEYQSELHRLNRQVKSLENRLKSEAGEVKRWEEILKGTKKDNPLIKVIEEELSKAEAMHASTQEKYDNACSKKDRCTLESVKQRLEADRAIKKLTKEDLKAKEEAEKKEEAPKEETKKEEAPKEGEKK